MRSTIFLVLLLVLAPALVSADDEAKPKKWWSTPLIIVIYIGFFLIAAGVSLCIRHYRDRHLHLDYHSDQHRGEERGLDAEEIDSLPSLRFSEMKMHRLKEGDQQLECAVCLSEFKDQEVLRILPDCFHVFHPSCIAPWLASHVTCPICRSSLEHRQGSSVSMSSIIDGLSGPMSQRFGHSGYYQHDHEDDNDDDHDQHHDDHVTVDIYQGSSSLHSEVNLDGPRVTSGIGKLHRSYSAGDLTRINSTIRSTSWSSLLPKESSPKNDYRTTLNKGDHLICISPKSDSSIDYSSLIMSVQMKISTVMSASHVASVPES